MKGQLIIPVDYKGKKLKFKGKLMKSKYGYKIKVKIDGGEVVFEEDVEGRYEVVSQPRFLEGGVDGQLLKEILSVFEETMKQ